MTQKEPFPNDPRQRFLARVDKLWPVALGSLSLRKSPCTRPHCKACDSGVQHPSFVLYGRLRGRRYAIYVPRDLVPEVRRALKNGRQLQELLHESGQRFVRARKKERGQPRS